MTILNGTDTSPNRLVEMLAGSASLLADPTSNPVELPVTLSTLTGEISAPEADADASAQASGSGLLDTLNVLNAPATTDAAAPAAAVDQAGVISPVTSLLDGVAPDSNVDGLAGIFGATNVVSAVTGDDGHSPLDVTGGDGGILGGLSGENGGLVGGVLGLLDGNTGGPTTSETGTTLDLAGSDGTVQPVFDATNAAIKDFHYQLEILSHETGTNDIVHGLTNLGETIGLGEIGQAPSADGHSNILTDVINAPGDLLDGNVNGVISNIGHDLTDTVHSAFDLVDAVLNGNDPTNPVPELIQGIGHDLQSLPLLTINNGDTGGLLGAVVGDLTHSSSNHLIDASVGQPSDQQGLIANLLAAPDSGAHSPVDVNVVDVGPTGPHLLDLSALTGSDGINIPSLGGAGADGLVGNVLSSVTSGGAGDTSVLAPVTQIVDSTVHDLLPNLLSADHGLLDTHGTHLI